MFMTQNIETTNAIPNQRDAAVEPHAGRPRLRRGAGRSGRFRRHYHFTPALAAVSGSICRSTQSARSLTPGSESLAAFTNAGNACLMTFASGGTPRLASTPTSHKEIHPKSRTPELVSYRALANFWTDDEG